VGRNRSVCVGLALEPRLPGYVRRGSIARPARVIVEFEPHERDEGEIRFVADFDALEPAISFLESFLETPLSDWENFTATGRYPEPESFSGTSTWEEVQRIAATLIPRDPLFVQVS
jgi:hypothetical protein